VADADANGARAVRAGAARAAFAVRGVPVGSHAVTITVE
jgi:hypothetical protein